MYNNYPDAQALSQIAEEKDWNDVMVKKLVKSKVLYNSKLLFALFIFPQIRERKDSFPSCFFHDYCFNVIDEIWKRSSKRKGVDKDLDVLIESLMRVIISPREHAKSTIAVCLLCTICIIFSLKKNIALIGNTVDNQTENVRDFMEWINHNPHDDGQDNSINYPLFYEYYPLSCLTEKGEFKRYKDEDKFITANDIMLRCFGLKSAIRGRKYKSKRPGLIILDDIEKDENVESLKQRDKSYHLFWDSVVPMGDEHPDIVLVGTIPHYDAAISRLARHQRLHGKFFKALIEEPERKDLWSKFDFIFNDKMFGEEKAIQFYYDNKTKMDQGAKVLWPERNPLLKLMLLKVSNPSSFYKEYQNDPIPLESKYFHHKIFDEEGKKKLHWDSSVGVIKRGMDSQTPTCILIVRYNEKKKEHYITEEVFEVLSPEKIAKWMVFFTESEQVGRYYVEEGFYNKALKHSIMNIMHGESPRFSVRKYQFPCSEEEINLWVDALQVGVSHQDYLFYRKLNCLMDQMGNYPQVEFTTSIHALSVYHEKFAKYRKRFRISTSQKNLRIRHLDGV